MNEIAHCIKLTSIIEISSMPPSEILLFVRNNEFKQIYSDFSIIELTR